MKETILYNEWNEPEAVSVKLEDVKEFLLGIDPDLKIEITFDDDDEYGCDHYLSIKGECASIVLRKDYGGMFCPADCLVGTVEPHCFRDKSTVITEFSLKNEIKEVVIGENYTTKIKDFFERNKKYLNGSSDLFIRTEYFYFDHPGGDQLLGNPRHSVSSKVLTDDEFHTDEKNKFRPKLRNIQFWSAKEANVLSDHQFNEQEYSDIKLIDEWNALSFLIKEKKMRWVVDALIENTSFFINEDGHLDCSVESNAEDLNINFGRLKGLCHSKIIEYAFNNGFDFNVILDIVEGQAIDSEYSEKNHWTTYTLKDTSEIVIYDNRTDVICTHEPQTLDSVLNDDFS